MTRECETNCILHLLGSIKLYIWLLSDSVKVILAVKCIKSDLGVTNNTAQ